MNFLKKLPFKIILPLTVLIFIILILTLVGFSIWLILFLVLGILLYLISFTKVLKIQLTNPFYISISIIILIILGISIIVLSNKQSTSTNETLTKEQCAPIYSEYNNKVLDITGDGIKGTVGIKINEEDCRATVTYNLLYNVNLTRNFKLYEYSDPDYEYIGVLRSPDEKREDGDYGLIFAVMQNKDKLPDPYTMALDEIDYGRNDPTASSSTFVDCWQNSYIFKKERFDKILSKTIYEIVDGSNDMDIEKVSDSGYSYSINQDLTAKNGNVVKTFTLTYTER